MERGRKESLRRKLVNPSLALMNEISNQIIELGEDFPKDLLEIYIKNIVNGCHPDKSVLLKVVVALQNKELYNSPHEGLLITKNGCIKIINFLENHQDIKNDLFNFEGCVEEFALQRFQSMIII
jgi:hypothetical protein